MMLEACIKEAAVPGRRDQIGRIRAQYIMIIVNQRRRVIIEAG